MGIESKSSRPMNVTAIDLLPKPLKEVRVQASKLLASMIANLFDNTDDALFELADKAVNSDDQTMYFDSMREVRIKRQVMESLFARSLQDNFKVFQRSSATEQQASSEESGTFSLMQDDELEESVAIRGMVSKINTLFGRSLPQLIQRMDFLAAQVTIDEGNNPVGPVKLSESFQYACQELSLNIRAKLMIYKLFEKHVLEELDELYFSANESLVAAGVLPQLKASETIASNDKVRKSKGKIENQTSSEKTAADQNEVFDQLRNLLANSSVPPQGSRNYLPVVDSGPVLSQAELVKMLSTVQQQSDVVVGSAQPISIDVRQALHNIVDGSGGAMPQAVGRVDDDSMNLVSMLFEYILDDHSLPVTMKALLGRLQIPMLKVALLDKSFFSRGAHPARKLLNKLASSALRWNEPADVSRDPLFNKVNDIVTSILDDFESNVEIFTLLLEDFSQFVGKEKRRSALIEQRTRDAEEGLAKTQRARAAVGKLINDKAAGKRLPTTVVSIFREGWSNYLFLLFVKEGTDSEAWTNAVQVVDDLIWSVSPDDSFGHRSGLLKMIPSLLKRLREGMNAISFSKNRIRELFAELEGIHMACLRRKPDVSDDAVDTPASSASLQLSDALEQQSDNLAGDKSSKAVVSEIIVDAPVLEPINSEEASATTDNEFSTVVDAMVVGAWVEFSGQEKENTRCKLAAIIRSSGKYIFVNRVGIKVAEYTRSCLIVAAQQGSFSMLDNALLFDRALESVIGHLREMKD